MSERSPWREVFTYDSLALFALGGLAVTQPLLDLFGKNPEFFVAADATRGQIVAFACVLAFAIPLIGLLLEVVAHAINHRLGAAVHSVLIGLLGAAFVATIIRHLDVDVTVLAAALAVGAGVGIAVLERRTRAMRLGLKYLALAPLLFLGLFLFTSSSSRLLWEDEAEAATGVRVGNPRPVVVVVFDELPIASLMTPDGQINRERFPGFARLADAGIWFRNATSLSPNTPGSVPTIESGLAPQSGSLPTSIDYPRNLFTLLGGAYDLDVTETITELCPTDVCPNVAEPGEEPLTFVQRLRRSLGDATVVYGHVALPADLRDDLPVVDQTWGGFIEDSGVSSGSSGSIDESPPSTAQGIDDFMQERNQEMRATNPRGRGELMRRMTERIDRDPRRLYFVHDALMPHFNWTMTPDEHRYRGEGGPPGSDEGTWGSNDFLVRQGQQRHLLQVGFADALLGHLIDKLEDEGVWDDAVVAVVADHGIAFRADQPKRTPTDENVHEIYRVPMILKLPGEEGGQVRDDNVQVIDIVPTIVDLLDVDTDWKFDGRSLVSDAPPPDEKRVYYGSGPGSVPLSIDGLLAAARRNGERFPNGSGWRGVAAVGSLGPLVGQDADELDVRPRRSGSWTFAEADDMAGVNLDGGVVPLVVHGELDLGGDAEPPEEGLVVLNGRVAGVAGGFARDGSRFTFRALLDFQQFEDGENTVALLLPTEPGPNPPFREVELRSLRQ